MTANVLKMANSSYFGVAQKIDSISHALMILGLPKHQKHPVP